MVEIVVVISNYEEVRELVEWLNILFYYMKVNKDIRVEVEKK